MAKSYRQLLLDWGVPESAIDELGPEGVEYWGEFLQPENLAMLQAVQKGRAKPLDKRGLRNIMLDELTHPVRATHFGLEKSTQGSYELGRLALYSDLKERWKRDVAAGTATQEQMDDALEKFSGTWYHDPNVGKAPDYVPSSSVKKSTTTRPANSGAPAPKSNTGSSAHSGTGQRIGQESRQEAEDFFESFPPRWWQEGDRYKNYSKTNPRATTNAPKQSHDVHESVRHMMGAPAAPAGRRATATITEPRADFSWLTKIPGVNVTLHPVKGQPHTVQAAFKPEAGGAVFYKRIEAIPGGYRVDGTAIQHQKVGYEGQRIISPEQHLTTAIQAAIAATSKVEITPHTGQNTIQGAAQREFRKYTEGFPGMQRNWSMDYKTLGGSRWHKWSPQFMARMFAGTQMRTTPEEYRDPGKWEGVEWPAGQGQHVSRGSVTGGDAKTLGRWLAFPTAAFRASSEMFAGGSVENTSYITGFDPKKAAKRLQIGAQEIYPLVDRPAFESPFQLPAMNLPGGKLTFKPPREVGQVVQAGVLMSGMLPEGMAQVNLPDTMEERIKTITIPPGKGGEVRIPEKGVIGETAGMRGDLRLGTGPDGEPLTYKVGHWDQAELIEQRIDPTREGAHALVSRIRQTIRTADSVTSAKTEGLKSMETAGTLPEQIGVEALYPAFKNPVGFAHGVLSGFAGGTEEQQAYFAELQSKFGFTNEWAYSDTGNWKKIMAAAQYAVKEHTKMTPYTFGMHESLFQGQGIEIVDGQLQEMGGKWAGKSGLLGGTRREGADGVWDVTLQKPTYIGPWLRQARREFRGPEPFLAYEELQHIAERLDKGFSRKLRSRMANLAPRQKVFQAWEASFGRARDLGGAVDAADVDWLGVSAMEENLVDQEADPERRRLLALKKVMGDTPIRFSTRLPGSGRGDLSTYTLPGASTVLDYSALDEFGAEAVPFVKRYASLSRKLQEWSDVSQVLEKNKGVIPAGEEGVGIGIGARAIGKEFLSFSRAYKNLVGSPEFQRKLMGAFPGNAVEGAMGSDLALAPRQVVYSDEDLAALAGIHLEEGKFTEETRYQLDKFKEHMAERRAEKDPLLGMFMRRPTSHPETQFGQSVVEILSQEEGIARGMTARGATVASPWLAGAGKGDWDADRYFTMLLSDINWTNPISVSKERLRRTRWARETYGDEIFSPLRGGRKPSAGQPAPSGFGEGVAISEAGGNSLGIIFSPETIEKATAAVGLPKHERRRIAQQFSRPLTAEEIAKAISGEESKLQRELLTKILEEERVTKGVPASSLPKTRHGATLADPGKPGKYMPDQAREVMRALAGLDKSTDSGPQVIVEEGYYKSSTAKWAREAFMGGKGLPEAIGRHMQEVVGGSADPWREDVYWNEMGKWAEEQRDDSRYQMLQKEGSWTKDVKAGGILHGLHKDNQVGSNRLVMSYVDEMVSKETGMPGPYNITRAMKLMGVDDKALGAFSSLMYQYGLDKTFGMEGRGDAPQELRTLLEMWGSYTPKGGGGYFKKFEKYERGKKGLEPPWEGNLAAGPEGMTARILKQMGGFVKKGIMTPEHVASLVYGRSVTPEQLAAVATGDPYKMSQAGGGYKAMMQNQTIIRAFGGMRAAAAERAGFDPVPGTKWASEWPDLTTLGRKLSGGIDAMSRNKRIGADGELVSSLRGMAELEGSPDWLIENILQGSGVPLQDPSSFWNIDLMGESYDVGGQQLVNKEQIAKLMRGESVLTPKEVQSMLDIFSSFGQAMGTQEFTYEQAETFASKDPGYGTGQLQLLKSAMGKLSTAFDAQPGQAGQAQASTFNTTRTTRTPAPAGWQRQGGGLLFTGNAGPSNVAPAQTVSTGNAQFPSEIPLVPSPELEIFIQRGTAAGYKQARDEEKREEAEKRQQFMQRKSDGQTAVDFREGIAADAVEAALTDWFMTPEAIEIAEKFGATQSGTKFNQLQSLVKRFAGVGESGDVRGVLQEMSTSDLFMSQSAAVNFGGWWNKQARNYGWGDQPQALTGVQAAIREEMATRLQKSAEEYNLETGGFNEVQRAEELAKKRALADKALGGDTDAMFALGRTEDTLATRAFDFATKGDIGGLTTTQLQGRVKDLIRLNKQYEGLFGEESEQVAGAYKEATEALAGRGNVDDAAQTQAEKDMLQLRRHFADSAISGHAASAYMLREPGSATFSNRMLDIAALGDVDLGKLTTEQLLSRAKQVNTALAAYEGEFGETSSTLGAMSRDIERERKGRPEREVLEAEQAQARTEAEQANMRSLMYGALHGDVDAIIELNEQDSTAAKRMYGAGQAVAPEELADKALQTQINSLMTAASDYATKAGGPSPTLTGMLETSLAEAGERQKVGRHKAGEAQKMLAEFDSWDDTKADLAEALVGELGSDRLKGVTGDLHTELNKAVTAYRRQTASVEQLSGGMDTWAKEILEGAKGTQALAQVQQALAPDAEGKRTPLSAAHRGTVGLLGRLVQEASGEGHDMSVFEEQLKEVSRQDARAGVEAQFEAREKMAEHGQWAAGVLQGDRGTKALSRLEKALKPSRRGHVRPLGSYDRKTLGTLRELVESGQLAGVDLGEIGAQVEGLQQQDAQAQIEEMLKPQTRGQRAKGAAEHLLSEFSMGGAFFRMMAINRLLGQPVQQWQGAAAGMSAGRAGFVTSMGGDAGAILNTPLGSMISQQARMSSFSAGMGEGVMMQRAGLLGMAGRFMGGGNAYQTGRGVGGIVTPLMTGAQAGLNAGVIATAVGGAAKIAAAGATTGPMAALAGLGTLAAPIGLGVAGITGAALLAGEAYEMGGKSNVQRELIERQMGYRKNLAVGTQIGMMMRGVPTSPVQSEEEMAAAMSRVPTTAGKISGQSGGIDYDYLGQEYLADIPHATINIMEAQAHLEHMEIEGLDEEGKARVAGMLSFVGVSPDDIASGAMDETMERMAGVEITGRTQDVASTLMAMGGAVGLAPGVGLDSYLSGLLGNGDLSEAGLGRAGIAAQILGGSAMTSGEVASISQILQYSERMAAGESTFSLEQEAQREYGTSSIVGAMGYESGSPMGKLLASQLGQLTPGGESFVSALASQYGGFADIEGMDPTQAVKYFEGLAEELRGTEYKVPGDDVSYFTQPDITPAQMYRREQLRAGTGFEAYGFLAGGQGADYMGKMLERMGTFMDYGESTRHQVARQYAGPVVQTKGLSEQMALMLEETLSDALDRGISPSALGVWSQITQGQGPIAQMLGVPAGEAAAEFESDTAAALLRDKGAYEEYVRNKDLIGRGRTQSGWDQMVTGRGYGREIRAAMEQYGLPTPGPDAIPFNEDITLSDGSTGVAAYGAQRDLQISHEQAALNRARTMGTGFFSNVPVASFSRTYQYPTSLLTQDQREQYTPQQLEGATVEMTGQFGGYSMQTGLLGQITMAQNQMARFYRGRELRNMQFDYNYDNQRDNLEYQKLMLQTRYRQNMESLGLQETMWQQNVGFQRQQMGWQWEGMQLQQERGREDWAIGRQWSGTQFEWGMEDLDEAIRFSTGRDKRKLIRQRDRQEETFAFESGQAVTQKERMEEDWAIQEEQFAARRTHFEEMTALQQQQFEMRRRHATELFNLQMAHLEEQAGKVQKNYEIQKELMKLSDEGQEESIKFRLANLEGDKVYYEQIFDWQKEREERENEAFERNATFYGDIEERVGEGGSTYTQVMSYWDMHEARARELMNILHPTAEVGGKEGKAFGGPIFAGEPTLVGEEGPEVIIPTEDSQVFNNAMTNALLNGGTGSVGGGTSFGDIIINVPEGNYDTTELVAALRAELEDVIDEYADGQRMQGGRW